MSGLSNMRWFILTLIINVIIAVIYLILKLIFSSEDHKKSTVIRFFIMLLCPVLGPVFIGISYLFYLAFFHKEVDLSDVIFNKERVEAKTNIDEDRERNLVSVEEAVNVTDKQSLRALMMNVVREDVSRSLSSIAMAMNSKDTETAHYAASVLQDVLNDFRIQVQKKYKFIMEDQKKRQEEKVEESEEQKNERIFMMRNLITDMNQVLMQKVFTKVEQSSFVKMMEDVLEIIYKEDPESIESNMYEDMILRLIELENTDHAKKWCDILYDAYPNTLMSYTCRLKLYFTLQDYENFEKVMSDLRSSDIVIDRETLEMIQAFQ